MFVEKLPAAEGRRKIKEGPRDYPAGFPLFRIGKVDAMRQVDREALLVFVTTEADFCWENGILMASVFLNLQKKTEMY